ncbi:MAG: DUF4139 domain-containing protein [Polyangiaceae bacterium]|nr:DUF4139 domain-containing protein [Polyangiaceae bacterium]
MFRRTLKNTIAGRMGGLALFAALGLSAATTGCTKNLPVSEPIRTDAALGKVVIYRNGVAYFERRALVRGDKLTLTVPSGKIDDFLKSLTIVNAKTGESLPVAYPTVDESGDDTELTIQLPGKGPHDLAISYVTESPAWKPSYRVELDKTGSGQLEAWAVVDNVSGEDWKRVHVGVGSSSALSFRYDLASVRLIERETLSDNAALALAPPTGGSSYTVAKKEVQVLGGISDEELERNEDDKVAMAEAADTAKVLEQSGYGGVPASGRSRPSAEPRPATKSPAKPRGDYAGAGEGKKGKDYRRKAANAAGNIAARAQQHGRIRVEGYAKPGDDDGARASLDRANKARDLLIANGVDADNIEVVATGKTNTEGVRVIAVDQPVAPEQPKHSKGTAEEPTGSAYFMAKTPMSIERDHSAMISLVKAKTEVEPVYYYDPVSARGSQQFAFKAVRIKNPTQYTLDQGPFTVYAKGQFLGEGLSEAIPPKSEAFIPYALDRQVVVETKEDAREEIDQLVTIQRGIVTAQSQRIRRTKLELANKGQEPVHVFIRHATKPGYELVAAKGSKQQKLNGAYLFPVTIPAGGSVDVEIEEATPITASLDMATPSGAKAISLYLKTSKTLDPDLRKGLQEVLALHRAMSDAQDKVDTLHRQMAEYRNRIDEIHIQLVTLKKVPQAQTLSRGLAKKMEEISDRLQKATLDVATVEGEQMTRRVELQDKLAELKLKPANERVAVK